MFGMGTGGPSALETLTCFPLQQNFHRLVTRKSCTLKTFGTYKSFLADSCPFGAFREWCTFRDSNPGSNGTFAVGEIKSLLADSCLFGAFREWCTFRDSNPGPNGTFAVGEIKSLLADSCLFGAFREWCTFRDSNPGPTD